MNLSQTRTTIMKKQLRDLLERGELEEIATLAESKTRVLGSLVSLTFETNPLIRWRAIDAMGAVTRRIVDEDPDTIRELLRRLFWLICEESGGICWHAPEAMAEVVCQKPELFSEYVPITMMLLLEMADEDLEHFRFGILWAIGRMGPLTRKDIPDVLAQIIDALDNEDPQVRGVAVWCLDKVGRAELLADREDLLDDQGVVDLYEDGKLMSATISDLTKNALSNVSTTT